MKLSTLSFVALYVLQERVVSSTAAFTVGGPVNTTVGTVQGFAALNRTDVSVYLGIPFAEAPLGNLRFAAPVAKSRESVAINATKYSADCPNFQASSSSPSLASLNPTAQHDIAASSQVRNNMSEDCLTLNIWTKPQMGEAKKAVLLWIYGGGFKDGTSDLVLYDGQFFADEEDIVVVSINYRVNIFGFSNAPGITQNVGLLDQRLAVEWVRDNIANFGGDANRITLFGQSAGGASVDYYSYAWVDDPIVNGFIPESGSVFLTSIDRAGLTNATGAWYNASAALGCGGVESGNATVSCMRTKDVGSIINATQPPAGGVESILGKFYPQPDGVVVFDDYAARGAAGNFIKKPYFIGNTDNEASLFQLIVGAKTLPDQEVELVNLAAFTCPAQQEAAFRVHSCVPTWRYRWFADPPNLRLTNTSGAYHTIEIAIIWGTTYAQSGVEPTTAEVALGNYTRNIWATFAKDPVQGLTGLGLKSYDPNAATLIQFGFNNQTDASYALPMMYDAPCTNITGKIPLNKRASATCPAIPSGSGISATSGGASATASGASVTTSVVTSAGSTPLAWNSYIPVFIALGAVVAGALIL